MTSVAKTIPLNAEPMATPIKCAFPLSTTEEGTTALVDGCCLALTIAVLTIEFDVVGIFSVVEVLLAAVAPVELLLSVIAIEIDLLW